MDKTLKEKWVRALRSGRYKQTTGAYERRGNYCCLGVLACVANRKKIDEVACDKWWGMVSERQIPGRRKTQTLVNLNDDDCKTFPEIADYIEKNL